MMHSVQNNGLFYYAFTVQLENIDLLIRFQLWSFLSLYDEDHQYNSSQYKMLKVAILLLNVKYLKINAIQLL